MAGIPGIKEFPSDDKVWRVDWFGALQYNPSVHLEPTFQVIISPIVKSDVFLMDFGKLASVQIVDYDQQKIFEIGDVLAGITEERGVWVNVKPYRLASIFLDSYKHVWPTAEEFAQSLAKRIKAN